MCSQLDITLVCPSQRHKVTLIFTQCSQGALSAGTAQCVSRCRESARSSYAVQKGLGRGGKIAPRPHTLTEGWIGWLVGCLTSWQQASVSQGRICLDNFTCCHTEIEVADQTFYLTQSQYTDTGPTSPSADPITPGAWLGSHWSANF